MSVLCEAISVVVRADVLERKYPGGVDGYQAACPNATYCRDAELTRVGFTHPDDARAFIANLEAATQLTAIDGEQFADLAVVDQFDGLTMPCPWLCVDITDGITRAWLEGRDPARLATPEGWSGPTTMKWDLDQDGNTRLRTPEGFDLDPTEPVGFISTDAPMAPTIADELRRLASVGSQLSPTSAHEGDFKQQLRDQRRSRDAIGALHTCTAWTEAEPTSVDAWYELGVVATSIHRMDLAEAAWRQTVRLAPNHGKGLANLGTAIVNQGRPRGAREWLERALEIDQNDPVALLSLGKSLIASGDQEQAETQVIHALREARTRRMQGVAIEASKVLDDLRHLPDEDVNTCDECGGTLDSECANCGTSTCAHCAERDSGEVLCDECYEEPVTFDVPAETSHSPVERKKEPTPILDRERSGEAQDRQPQGSSAASTTKHSGQRWAGVIGGLLAFAWVLNGGLAFLPNHPELTFDATAEYLSPQGFIALLDEACNKPPIWKRSFQKSPSEITIHATNQLGKKATLVRQCEDGRVDPDDEGSILKP
jgi:hypothetical protein